MEKRGEAGWHCLYNASGRVIGREFRMNELTRSNKRSPCTLTPRVMWLNGMAQQFIAGEENSAVVREAEAKVRLWPFIGDQLRRCIDGQPAPETLHAQEWESFIPAEECDSNIESPV